MQPYKCFVGSSGDSLAFDMLGVICIKPAGALKMLVLRFFLIVRAGISAVQHSTPSAHSQAQPLHNCAQIGVGGRQRALRERHLGPGRRGGLRGAPRQRGWCQLMDTLACSAFPIDTRHKAGILAHGSWSAPDRVQGMRVLGIVNGKIHQQMANVSV